MKKLLLVLLFISSVQAEEIAWTPNKAGGRIVLTNETCWSKGKEYPSLYRSYMVVPGGSSMSSCYIVENDVIHMVYEDGSEYRYSISGFTLKYKKGNSI